MSATTSTKSKDRKERQDNSNKQQANEIKKVVNKRLGLTAVGGLGGNNQGYIAANLQGKNNAINSKSNKLFYGEEASKFTDDEMVKRDLVKEGNYFKQVGGNFVRIGREEGQKLYAAGDPSISRSTMGNKNSNAIKYGNTNSAMGSGDPSGAMTSIPISSKMLQSQNKFKGLTTAALSFAGGGIGGGLMRASATKNLADAAQPELAYNDYSQQFDATQKGEKFKSERSIASGVGKAFSMLTGKRKKTSGKSTAGSTIIGNNSGEGLGN
jgi:hypothetical protein